MSQEIEHPTLGILEFPDGMSRADMVAAIKNLEAKSSPAPVAQQAAPAPSASGPSSRPASPWTPADGRAAPLPPSSLAGALADTGTEAAAAAGGQALGLMTGPMAPVAVPTFGGIAALSANLINQYKGGNGIKAGEAVSAFVGGLLPGGSEIKAGGKIARAVLKPLVVDTAANLATAEAQNIIDNGSKLSKEQAAMVVAATIGGSKVAHYLNDGMMVKSINGARQAELTAAKLGDNAVKEGWTIWPSASNRTSSRVEAERLADPGRTQFEMSVKNLDIADKKVRDGLDLYTKTPTGETVAMPINSESIDLRRGGYEQTFSDIGTKANVLSEVNQVRDLRRAAAYQFRMADSAQNPESAEAFMEKARKIAEDARLLDEKIVASAKAIDPKLADEFLKTRRQYAQSFAVEHSLDAAGLRQGVDPQKLAKWQDRKNGQDLTDEIGDLAKMAQHFPDIVVGPTGLYKQGNALRSRHVGWIPRMTAPASAGIRSAMMSNVGQQMASGAQTRFIDPGLMSRAATQAPRALSRQMLDQGYPATQ